MTRENNQDKQPANESKSAPTPLKKLIAENRPFIRQILEHIATDAESRQIVQEELAAVKAACPPCAVACEPWPL